MKKLLFLILILICSPASAWNQAIDYETTSGPYNWGNNANLGYDLSTSVKRAAISITSDIDMTVAKVGFSVSSVTGTPVAYTVGLQSAGSDGKPSGSLACASASATLSSGTSAGIKELTLTSTCAITAGTRYFIVFSPDSSPLSNYITLRATNFGPGVTNSYLFTSGDSGSTWSKGNDGWGFLKSNDGTPKPVSSLLLTGEGTVTVTNTVWYGIKFTADETSTALGACTVGINSSSANIVKAFLIDSSNNILATGTLSDGAVDDISNVCIPFATAYDITQGSTYRVVIKDSGGNYRLRDVSLDSSYNFGPWADVIRTNGTSSDGNASPTSWTDTSTGRIAVKLLLKGKTDSAGGGASAYTYAY